MLNFRKRIFLFLTIIAVVLGLVGCSDASNTVRINFDSDEYEVRMQSYLEVKPTIKADASLSLDEIEVIYESSDESIVRYQHGVLYPVSEGEAEIKVYWKDKEVVFDKATVKVIKPALPEFVYDETQLFLKNGQSNLNYSLRYNYTEAKAVFSSLTPEIATITEDGVVSAIAVGTAEFKAVISDSKESVEVKFSITVTESDYAINYVLDGGVNAEGNPVGYNALEVPLPIAAPSKPGYEFVGWLLNNQLVNAIPAGTLGDVTLVAIWQPVDYSINYDLANGTIAEGNPETYNVEQLPLAIPAAPTREGYEFAGWTLNGEVVTEIPAGTLDDVTLVATWKAVDYAINYDLANGTATEGNPATYNVEQLPLAIPAAPTKEGYEFAGWALNGEVVAEIPAGSKGEITLVATWKPVQYSINFDANGGNLSGLKASQEIGLEFLADLNAAGGSSLTTESFFSNSTAPIKAMFGKAEMLTKWNWLLVYMRAHLVEYNGENASNGYVVSTLNTLDLMIAGDTAAMSAGSPDGPNARTLIRAYMSGVMNNTKGNAANETFSKYAPDFSDEATRKGLEAAAAAAAGIVSSYNVESVIELPVASREGYEFAGWYNGDTKLAKIEAGTTGDLSLVAKWNAIKYSVSFELDGGEISGKYATREEMVAAFLADFNSYANTSITSPAEYWAQAQKTSFWKNAEMHAKWSWIFKALIPLAKAQGQSTDYLSNMVANPVSISGYATQNVAIYLLGINNTIWNETYKSANGGLSSRYTTVDCTSPAALDSWKAYVGLDVTFTVEDEVELPVAVKAGVEFAGWYNGDVKVEKIEKGTIGDLTLVAKWEVVKYSDVTYVLNEGTLPEGAPTQYKEGTGIAKLPVPTREGFEFVGWYVGETKVESISAEQTGAVELTAKWEEIVYSNISYVLNEGVNAEDAPTQYREGVGLESLPVPTREGYNFLGWYVGENKVESISAEQTGAVELTAKWEEIIVATEYSISYDLAEGAWPTEKISTYAEMATAFVADYQAYITTLGYKDGTLLPEKFMDVSYNYGNLDDFFDHADYAAKWGWVRTFVTEYCAKVGDQYASNIADKNASYHNTILRGNVHGFINNSKWDSWPKSADYSGVVFADFEAKLPAGKVVEGPATYEIGKVTELVTPVREGYDFAGWLVNGEVIAEISADMSGDLALVARWRAASGEEGVIYVGAEREYKTLADALAVAMPGDVIKVDAGSYEGAEITVNGVTISGANAGVNPNKETRSTETVFTTDLIVSADNVVIDGIQITGSARVMGGANGAANVVVKNVWSFGSTVNQGNVSNIAPFYFSSKVKGVEYKNVQLLQVRVSNPENNRPMAGYFDQVNGLTIKDSEFVVKQVNYNDAIKLGNEGTWGVKGNVEIVGNVFENFAQYVLWFQNYQEGTYNIENNTFKNNGQTSSSHCAVRFAAYSGADNGVSAINFRYNTVDNSFMLVRIDKSTSRTAETQPVKVNYNKLLNCGATYYIKNSNAYNIDGTNNYYDVTPSASLMLNVIWEPYYTSEGDVPLYGQELSFYAIEYVTNGGTLAEGAPAMYDSNVGLVKLPEISKENHIFQGWLLNGAVVTEIAAGTTGKLVLEASFRENALYVSKNGEEYAYTTLAAALEAAKEGDKIIILAGEWDEAVTVSKANLTIAGPNQGIDAVNGTRVAEAIIKNVISVDIAATNLTIDGLAFTAGGRVVATATSGTYEGFTFKNNKVYDTNASQTAWVVNRYLMDAVVEFRLKSGGKCKNFEILNNSFVNCPSVNVMVNRPHNLSVDGNLFKNFSQDAFRIEGGYTHGMHAFTNNVFEVAEQGDAHNGIFFYSLSGGDAFPVVVLQNNVFKNLGMADTSKFTGALSANYYQECGLKWDISNNIFDNCYNYMWLRNNGANASNWSSTIENNQFLGLPNEFYYGTYTGTDTESTNPHLNVFGANYYEDNDGNVITDMSTIADKFFHTSTYGTALAAKPAAVVADKYEFWTISYELNGGTAKGLVTEYNKDSGAIALPVPTWNIYHEFAGWELNGAIVTEIPAGTKGDLKVVAKWTEIEGNPVTLNFELNGGNWRYSSFEDICLDLLADYNAYGGTNYTQATLPDGAWVNINIHNFFYSEGMSEKWGWLATWLGTVGGSSNKAACAALPTCADATSFAAKNGNWPYAVSYEFRAIMRGSSITSNASYKTPDYSEASLNEQMWAPLVAAQSKTLDTTEGKILTLPAAHKQYLQFVGWFDNAELTGEPVTEITVGATNPTYYAKYIDPNPVTAIQVNNVITEINRFATHQLVWEVLPATTANKGVKFSSSNEKVATVSPDGLITAVAQGTCIIKLVSAANAAVFTELPIEVKVPTFMVGSYETTSYVKANETINLSAEIKNGEGTISWSSSDETIATVADGVVTALKAGVVTITAKSSSDENVKVDFFVTVIEGEVSEVLQFVLNQHNANIYTSYNLGIGAGTPAYYSDIYGSVSKILYNHELTIDDSYLAAGNASGDYYKNANTEFEGIQFVTFHYTAGFGATADTDNHASYFTGGSADVSIHYITGNHGSDSNGQTSEIYHTLDHNHGAWHAGDSNSRYYSNSTTTDAEGMRRFMWIPTGLAYDGADLEKLTWTASDDFYFEINGKKTTIKLPSTYNYNKRNTDHIYNEDGTITSQEDFTFEWAKFQNRTPESFFNSQGFVAKVIDGMYYMCPTWWSYGQVVEGRICAVGGNQNSIGIESCVNEGSDLWRTWQNSAQLIAKLLYDNNLGFDRVKGHHFFDGKDCPQPLLENDMAIWAEFIELIKAEYAAEYTYGDYEFSMVSNNPEIVDNNGRVINVPDFATAVSYTVTITKDGQSESITLGSVIPGIYEK